MGYRDTLLKRSGFDTWYDCQPKYRGSSDVSVCKARKDGKTYFPFRDTSGHLRRLAETQDSIPHMVRIAHVVDDVVLFEEARGSLLWEMDEIADPDRIATELLSFAEATAAAHLINGDVRPWNVFVGADGGVQVIDWNLSTFADMLTLDHHLLTGHYRTFHPKLTVGSITDIDRIDAERIIRLMKGNSGYRNEWAGDLPGWFPKWCRR